MPTAVGRAPTVAGNTAAPKSEPQDVKTVVPPSEDEPEADVQTEATDTESGIDDGDLKEFEEQKKVPYARFKEKVQEAKAFKSQLAEVARRFEEEKRRAIEDAELRVQARMTASKTEDPDLAPYEAKIQPPRQELRD